MKHILTYLFAFCLLGACTTEDNLPEITAYGTLKILPIEIQTEAETEVVKRSVDASLQVDILQGSTIVRTYEAGSTALNSTISLPVGSYTLIAHTPDMSEAADNMQGNATYSVSQAFQIQADLTTTLGNLTATQANIGIYLLYQDELFTTAFTSVCCTLRSPSTGRQVEITGVDNKNLTYFNIPESGLLEYSFSVTNADGETFESGVKTLETTTAKNYNLNINLN